MIKYHKKGKYKGKTIIELFNAQEHWDYLLDAMNIYCDYNGCWYIDLSHINDYPRVLHRGKSIKLTRLMAAIEKGCEVEDLDGHNDSWGHKCSNKACINPTHGRVVPHKVNMYDGDLGESNPVGVKAESAHEVLHFSSAKDSARYGFHPSSVSKASRGVHNKHNKHGGTHMYRGYYWTRT